MEEYEEEEEEEYVEDPAVDFVYQQQHSVDMSSLGSPVIMVPAEMAFGQMQPQQPKCKK